MVALLFSFLISSPAQASFVQKSCDQYLSRADQAVALHVVSAGMGYSVQELCSLPRLLAIHMDEKRFLNEQQEWVPHTWVTLHYNEYSCQYFVRKADAIVTRKNCYNTF